MSKLAALQRRFYAEVTGAGATKPGRSEPMIASGYLEIYANMYALRLHDALADDYPKLRTAFGDEPFAELVRRYFRDHPPSSFTLREAGADLPAVLREADWAPVWAHDLAALERARVEVFDGPDGTPLDHAAVVALGEALPELVVRWIPSSVLVPIGHAIDELWSAIEDGQPPFEPAEVARTVLVWRAETAVLHRTLDSDEAQLAPLLVRGARFAELCEVLAALHGDAAGPRAAELLMAWLAAEALVTPAH